MRIPLIEGPRRNGVYAAYVSNVEFAVNGVAIDKQASHDRNDGVWVRVVVESVDSVRCFSALLVLRFPLDKDLTVES